MSQREPSPLTHRTVPTDSHYNIYFESLSKIAPQSIHCKEGQDQRKNYLEIPLELKAHFDSDATVNLFDVVIESPSELTGAEETAYK